MRRIKSLVILPAWKEVWICSLENAHIQEKLFELTDKRFCPIFMCAGKRRATAFYNMQCNLAKRGNKHSYLKYLQNRREQTIAAAYSLLPHTSATFSTLLLCKEVATGLFSSAFNISSVFERIKKTRDIFNEFYKAEQV